MCGIVGKLSFEVGGAADVEFVRSACQVSAHRGPDDEGLYADGPVCLGHRRLSIIDVEGGSQPMSYADGRLWITHNGEIYNFRELRSELAGLGYEFTTSSDTEVILASYQAWGIECVGRLRGIFAFGLWDAHEGQLLLARDHLGVKPLLYSLDSRRLVFASELKALLQDPSVSRELSPQGLSDYLSLGYVLTPNTILDSVRKLPAGCSLVCTAEGRVHLERYWDLAELVPEKYQAAPVEADLEERYAEALREAVTIQMVSDVPLGAYLSGGIDSSTIVQLMSSSAPGTVKTFSAGFRESTFSELENACGVSEYLGTEHHEVVVPPSIVDEIPRLIWFYDEPLGDTSIVPTYFVSRLARSEVKVALAGDGCDETLAGYDTYTADKLHRIYRWVPGLLHRCLLGPLVNILPVSSKKLSLEYRLKQFISHARETPERAHYSWRLLFEDSHKRELLGSGAPTGSPFDRFSEHFRDVQHADPLNRSSYVDIKTWLVDDILVKLDRASMACGLEARVPFLDPRLVELTMSLPPRMKMAGWRRKAVLKKVMTGKLPDQVIHRRKRGFNAPVSLWLRGALRQPFQELLAGDSRCVDLGAPCVRRLWQEHLTGRADHGFKLWALASLLFWEREVLDGSMTPVRESRPAIAGSSSITGSV